MFCMKCGAPLPENAAVCPQCGAVADVAAGAPAYEAYQPQYAPAPEPVKTDFTEDFELEERQRLRWILVLGYLFPMFFLFPMLAYKDSKLTRFHLNQALCLLMLMLASSIVMVIPFLGWLAGTVGYGFWTVLLIIDIVRVIKLQAKWTPLVGKYVIMPLE